MFRTATNLMCLSILTLAFAAAVSAGFRSAEPAESSAEQITFSSKITPSALTTLRAIAGARQLEVVDEHTVMVTATKEAATVMMNVVKMIDSLATTEEPVDDYTVPTGDAVISAVRLQHAPVRDVMRALRTVLQFRAASTLAGSNSSQFLVLRDTPDKSRAARELIKLLDRQCQPSS